jgi:hypothetical protein
MAADDATQPVIASNARGDTVVAWLATVGGAKQVRVVVRTPGGGFGPEEVTLPNAGTSRPSVALDDAGDVAVAWTEADAGRVALRPAGGSLGAPVALTGEIHDVVVGMDRTGRATTVARRNSSATDGSCSTIQVRQSVDLAVQNVSLSGAAGPPQVIYQASECIINGGAPTVDALGVSVNARGDAIAGFRTTYAGGHPAVAVRPLAGGVFGGYVYVGSGDEPRVAIDAQGRYAETHRDANQVRIAQGTVPGSPGAIQTVSDPALTSGEPAVGIDGTATATVVWQSLQGSARRVFARTVSAAGALGALGPLSGPSSDSTGPFTDPHVAVNDAGGALALWRLLDAGGHYVLRAAARGPGAGFGAEAPVSGDASRDSRQGVVAIDAQGGGAAAFQRFDGTVNQIQIAAYDAQAPALGAVDAPAALVAGVPGHFRATASDDWGPVSLRWDLGDGGAIAGAEGDHAFGPGTPTVTVTATDGAGQTASATRTVAVSAFSVSGTAVVPSRFAVAAAPTAQSGRRRAPLGTAIRFRLNAPADVRVAIERPAAGRRSRGRCVRPTRALRRARRCTRWLQVGRLTRAGRPAGANSVRFTGRIGRRALALGRYRAVVSAAEGGQAATARAVNFTVVRR